MLKNYNLRTEELKNKYHSKRKTKSGQRIMFYEPMHKFVELKCTLHNKIEADLKDLFKKKREMKQEQNYKLRVINAPVPLFELSQIVY